jgi:biotin synthase-related radical SAM superfamily protein
VAVIVGPGHLRSVVNQRCVYQQTGQACRFCAVQHWWNAVPVKPSYQVAETVEAAYKEGVVRHISLTTATLSTPDRGLANLVETAKLIRSRARVPIMIEFEPLPDPALLESLLWEAREVGVTTVSINIECFDTGLRLVVMPAKGKIPVKEYLKNWKICLDIFGRNEVSTVAVAGIGEEDRSIIQGMEWAAARGVITFLVPHSPAIGAAFEDMSPPSTDRMLKLYEKAADIYDRYNLDLCESTAGCVRGGGFSAIKEVVRYGI